MRQTMAKVVIGDAWVDEGDRRLERRHRVSVGHIQNQRVVKERKESVASLLSINECHSAVSNIAVGVLNRRKLIIDTGKIAAQGASELGDLRRGGRGLTAQV